MRAFGYSRIQSAHGAEHGDEPPIARYCAFPKPRLGTFFTSVGFCDEQIHLYLATGLHAREVEPPDHDERIEIVRWPLEQLGEAIAATRDSKTLVGLLILQQRLRDAGS